MTNCVTVDKLAGLPGEDLMRKGLRDAASGEVTEEACLVSMASPRLLAKGLLTADTALVSDAELTLYHLLCRRAEDPYSRYNSLVRRLVSFEHALDKLPVT